MLNLGTNIVQSLSHSSPGQLGEEDRPVTQPAWSGSYLLGIWLMLFRSGKQGQGQLPMKMVCVCVGVFPAGVAWHGGDWRYKVSFFKRVLVLQKYRCLGTCLLQSPSKLSHCPPWAHTVRRTLLQVMQICLSFLLQKPVIWRQDTQEFTVIH